MQGFKRRLRVVDAQLPHCRFAAEMVLIVKDEGDERVNLSCHAFFLSGIK